MICWGALTMAQAAMRNNSTMLSLRLLIGVFEGGYVPLVYYYIFSLYPKYMAGLRLGLFAGMSLIGSAFSGLIAYGVLQLHSSRYAGWQILFLLEGGLTLLIALLILVFLPVDVGRAWLLTDRQRRHAMHRMQADNLNVGDGSYNPSQSDRNIRWTNVKDAITDWKKLLIIVCNICATVPVYGFGIFLPLIVQGMGYQGVKANLMSVPPFMV
jgi:MFS family permease